MVTNKPHSIRHYLGFLTLSTPRQRVTAWLLLTVGIFLSDVRWFENLSLYKRVGLEWMPSIGLTRAYWYLVHGDFTAAWQMNKLIYAVVLLGGSLVLYDIWRIISHYRQ